MEALLFISCLILSFNSLSDNSSLGEYCSLSFFSILIAMDSEVIRSSNGLQNAISKSCDVNFCHVSPVKVDTKFFLGNDSIVIKKESDVAQNQLPDDTLKNASATDSEKKMNFYFDFVLDISKSISHRQFETVESINDKIDTVRTFLHDDSIMKYLNYAQINCIRKPNMNRDYLFGSFIISKINLCYGLIKIYRAFEESLYDYKPYVKVWLLGNKAYRIDSLFNLNISNGNIDDFIDFSHVRSNVDRNLSLTDSSFIRLGTLIKCVISIPNSMLDTATNFLDFFDKYKKSIQNPIRTKLRSQIIINRNSLFLFSDCLHDPFNNKDVNLDYENFRLKKILCDIEKCNLKLDIYLMKTEDRLRKNTVEVDKLISEVFKSNSEDHNIYSDDNYIMFEHRYPNPVNFYYQVPFDDSCFCDFNVDTISSYSLRLLWNNNHLSYNPDFKYYLFDAGPKPFDSGLLRNGYTENLRFNKGIKRIRLAYKGNLIPQFSELEFQIINNSIGGKIRFNLLFIKIFNFITTSALVVIGIIMLIIYFSIFNLIAPKQIPNRYLQLYYRGVVYRIFTFVSFMNKITLSKSANEVGEKYLKM